MTGKIYCRRLCVLGLWVLLLLAISTAHPLLCLFVRLQSGRREPAMQVNPSAMHGRKRDAGMIRVS